MSTLQIGNGAVTAKPLVFDEKTKCAYLTVEELGQTMLLEDANGKLPRLTPVEHVTVLNDVLNLTAQYNLQVDQKPLVISENNVRRLKWKGPKNDCPLENYLVERLVTKFELSNMGSLEYEADAAGKMAVAVAYTEAAGIQIAFGHNVAICQNLNIWGENIFSTSGNDKSKVSYEKGMQLLERWLQNAEAIRKQYVERIEKLKARKLSDKMCHYILGRLFTNAVRFNAGERDVLAPLNQADCAAVVRAGYDKLGKEKEISAWDVTNWVTEVIKPERFDMPRMLTSNHRVNEFLYNELCN
jgi:hypothetical protein